MRKMLSLIIAAFALTGVAGCDRASSDELTGVQAPASDFLVWTWSGTPVTTTTAVETSTVTAVIGTQGGRVTNGPHSLTVPRGAVSGPTEFTFTVVGGNFIHTDFSAKKVANGAKVSTFSTPLQLKLSYANANVSSPFSLGVAYLVDDTVDGRKERVVSYVSTYTKTVTAFLTHFSQFILLERD
jgi:hypothetical protein